MNKPDRYHIGSAFFVKEKISPIKTTDLLEPEFACIARILLTGAMRYV
jgi:hypothetical protein